METRYHVHYRLAWNINGQTGHGTWHDSSIGMEAWVQDGNRICGAGTHWIENTQQLERSAWDEVNKFLMLENAKHRQCEDAARQEAHTLMRQMRSVRSLIKIA